MEKEHLIMYAVLIPVNEKWATATFQLRLRSNKGCIWCFHHKGEFRSRNHKLTSEYAHD